VSFLVVQFLTGLAGAASLFLVASGLSIIFGVTRIVNFAHGAFYMLGAYLAYSLTERMSGAIGFWGGLVAATLIIAALGAAIEIVLLRRIYGAPELFQLLATFGLTLIAEDLAVLVWGPEDLVGRRAPGFRGSVDILGQAVPSYDLFLMVLGPAVLGLLWLLFHRTRFGILVRAATQDRDMVAALGVNQRWLFTGVFALGVGLAALGGALQLPRDAVSHAMDLRVIVEVFVVVVIGGLGSVTGAFLAALIVSELNAFGILILPTISLVLVFVVMAAVLVLRPFGLLGKAEGRVRPTTAPVLRPWRPLTGPERLAVAALVAVAALLPLGAGNYALSVGAEILIFALFAASLQLPMSVGGLASFGHAAYFGLGAYGAALAFKAFGLPLLPAIASGILLGVVGAVVVGWFCVRLSGVYFAMLTLAFAQIAWSIAFQWTDVTGGDNGILGVWAPAWAAGPSTFYGIVLAIVVLGVGALRTIALSPFGYALRGVRDSDLRAEAIGISRRNVQWAAFVTAGGFAALAGALFVFLKGSVFPDSLGIPLSVDALVMVLLGGVGTVSGAVVGAIVYRALTILLMSQTDYSKLVLGLIVVTLVVAFPAGIVGSIERLRERVRLGAAAAGIAKLAAAE
jgi:branched-chain amino acid transport system permease protein